jgi:DNA-binding transcriptional LysR family regulator
MRFDLVDLRLFLHVAETQSITYGAEKAHLALASASERIRGMEDTLGTSLLIRNRRGVSLSPAGQCLVEHARVIIQQVERMRGELGCFARGLSGSVRLLCNAAALSEHLPRILAQFLSANPTLNLDIEECESVDIARALAAGAADVGIASAAALSDGIEQFPFRTDALVLLLPRGDPLSRKRKLRLADVIDRAFVGLPLDSALQRHLSGHASKLGAHLKIRARVKDFDGVGRMVDAGAGIGIVPAASATRYRGVNITCVKLDEPWAVRQLVICVRDLTALPIGAQRLVEHLKEAHLNVPT